MTAKELIEELKKYPPETRVVITSGDPGMDDIEVLDYLPVYLNCYEERFQYGRHQEKSYYDNCERLLEKNQRKTFETVNTIILSQEELVKFS